MHETFVYSVSSIVRLTGAQLQIMNLCSDTHWDANLRAFFEGPVGRLWVSWFRKTHFTSFAESPDKLVYLEMSQGDVTVCLELLEAWSGVDPIPGREELRTAFLSIWEMNEKERQRINTPA